MYHVDALDLVIALEGAPLPDISAPLPIVLANDWAVVLAYYGREPDSQKQPPTVVVHFGGSGHNISGRRTTRLSKGIRSLRVG
jgi:hypothetical protein